MSLRKCNVLGLGGREGEREGGKKERKEGGIDVFQPLEESQVAETHLSDTAVRLRQDSKY